MLDTAFYKKILSERTLSKSRLRARSKSQNKTWSYIGRFIWGFTMVEYQVNQLFQELLGPDLINQENDNLRKQKRGLGYAATLLLTYTLDLRKKSKLIEMILQDRGIDESAMFKRIHAFHDLRNVIAHWPFDEEVDQSGICCDYANIGGDTSFQKPGTRAKDNLITYAELDRYDIEVSELHEKLEKLVESATPIMEPSEDLRKAMIEEAIRASDNVLRFPASLGDHNTDEPE